MIIRFLSFNSHDVGIGVARPYGFELDFVRNLISWSAVWFFVVILRFTFTSIFEIEIYEKNSFFLYQHIF